MNLAEQVYRHTKPFPKDELFGLTSQMRRASVSVPANIAEGYGRESTASYIQFLRIAQGSLKELETLVLLANRVGLLSGADMESLLSTAASTGKMLRSLIRSLEKL